MTAPRTFSYADSLPDRRVRGIARLVEAASGRRRVEALYDIYRSRTPTADFFAEALRLLDIRLDWPGAALSRLPATGPLVFVANHPFGVVDGMALACLAAEARAEVRIVAHSALARIPETRRHLFPIDFSGTREAQKRNVESRAAAAAFLRTGGALVLFPAGQVSTAPGPFARRAEEARWGPLTARLVASTGAHVVPVHVEGQNSRLFQMVSHVSNPVRQALLFRESLRRRGTTLTLRVGAPIPPEVTRAIPDRAALMAYLRELTLALAGPDRTAADRRSPAA